MIDTKRCPNCLVALPASEFYRNASRKDGLSSWCKGCSNTWEKNRRRRAVGFHGPLPINASTFMKGIDKRPSGCWIWTGAVNDGGYGYVKTGNSETGTRRRRAHVVAHELFVGPVPDGLQLDHTCHNKDLSCEGGPTCEHRRCVNPAHLEPVTPGENSRRRSARQTHCKRGHEYTPENTRLRPAGGRSCRACDLINSRSSKARRRDTRPPENADSRTPRQSGSAVRTPKR